MAAHWRQEEEKTQPKTSDLSFSGFTVQVFLLQLNKKNLRKVFIASYLVNELVAKTDVKQNMKVAQRVWHTVRIYSAKDQDTTQILVPSLY